MSDTDPCTFVYDLFGVQIKSCTFNWPEIDKFKPERATAKIFTTPERLVKFLSQQKSQLFCIFILSDDQRLALAEIDLVKVLKVSQLLKIFLSLRVKFE
jgi:hypothetical protein